MDTTCVDAHLRKLIRIENYVKNMYLRRRFIDCWEDWYTDVLAKVQALKLELRFLKMFLWRFSTWDETNLHDSNTPSQRILNKFMCCCFAKREEDANVLMVCRRSTHSSIESIWEQIGGAQISVADPFLAILQPERDCWKVFASRIERAIQQCKPLVEENCERYLLDCSLKCKCLKSNEILQYLDIILENLKDLVRYKAGEFVSLKKQIEALEGRVMLLHNFCKLTSHGGLDSKNLRDFKSYVVTFASNAASVMFLYWTKAIDEETVTNTSLFDRLQKIIKPGLPEVMVLYFDALRAIKLERFDDRLLLGQVVANFVDHLLENHLAPLKDDTFLVLRDGLIFLLTFRADPPTQCNDLILMCKEIDVLLSEGSGLILQLDHYMTDFSDKGKMHFSDFVTKIENLKDRIIQRYVRIPDSSLLHFPVTNGLGFLDYLMQNLRDMKEKLDSDSMFIPFAKYHVIKIEEELMTLRPSLNDFPVLQNKLKIIEDTWLEVINLAYLTEHVINLCSIILYPIWYNMSYLSYVVKQIALLNGKTEKIKECKMYRNGDISCSVEILSEQDSYSRTNEEVVGFEAEADILIEKLRWGCKSFDVVPIVGMPGIGKTTMARKVYNSPIVRHHFNIFAFCTVSQVHNIRKLFLDILRDIIILDAKILSMTEQDLAHQLRKCLSGQRYLIVMDDMWDISAWIEVKSSFPENNNGSRVIITTRSHKVALKANGNPHILHLMSDENSWELLQKKVFCKEDCPQNLSEVGKVIAKNCKGLPLAVVLVAGLLSRTGRSLSSWSKIAETTCSYASMEGCKDMIELSYKHLPEYLKPCFLYFGAFSEDEAISAKRLMMLWIAEGFVQKSETRSIETVAIEYLNDLVDRSLVIVFKRSSFGGISTCGVHDLLYDFCETKAKDENFSQLIRGSVSSNFSSSPAPNFYRVFIQTNWRSYVEAETTGPNTHSLLYCHELDTIDSEKFHFRSLKLVQVLHLGKIILTARDFHCITSLVHLRYIAVSTSDLVSVPSSISNLYKLETLILIRRDALYGPISMLLPRTIWRMKRLRHVDVGIVHFDLNGDLEDDEAYIKDGDSFHVLDNVQRFSSLTLSCRSATNVELDGDRTDLLKRLPNVEELSCCLEESWESSVSMLTFEFLSKLESLKLYSHCYRKPSVIFPINLKKLTLSGFGLSWNGFSAIGKLPYLEVLKILDNSEKKWETEDAEFPNLKFLKLMDLDLEIWNASIDSFPCLERLVLNVCKNLVEIPASFGNLVTLKSIEVYMCNNGVATSAVEIQNEQMNYGNELQLKISNYFED